MKIDFAVVCDYALIDRYGKLSVLGIFHHIWVSQFPTVHPRLHLVLRLRGARTEIGEHKVQIKLIDADGREIITGDGEVSFSEPPAGVLEVEAGAVLVFDVPFENAGKYQFEIEVDAAVRTAVPITVSLGPRSQSRETTEPD
ncbi:MAG: hypothetical protein JSW71_00055 [Gemmatimonadota bacterium]|nr:MAG: hypothetical protein JSW71_00055 [Gemmatimonadota bacterium]